jgi:phosphoribosyl 1,2-cyclic phosphodiesterase
MRFCVLGSGSKGNCTYVASEKTAVLIDAGFSGVEVERRLSGIGVDISRIAAILLTHEHGDHVKGVSVLSRRHGIMVYANQQTRDAAGTLLQNLHEFTSFSTGKSFHINDLEVHPFAVSHDTVDPVGFTISDERARMGYCTDTGMVSKLIHHHLSSCHGLVLECNHDLEMLRNGHYPVHVQQRVRSKKGHLANPQAVEFIKELYNDGLEHVVLAHISDSNNSADIIRRIVAELLRELGDLAAEKKLLQISLSFQNQAGAMVLLK